MTEGHYHAETSPMLCSTNQWTGFYMVRVNKKRVNKRVNKKDVLIRLVIKQTETMPQRYQSMVT